MKVVGEKIYIKKCKKEEEQDVKAWHVESNQ